MPLPEFKTWLEVIEFEDHESLDDSDLFELFDLQYEALEKLQTIDPTITDEVIQNFKKGVNAFAMAHLKAIEATKAAAIAQRNLDASIDRILSHPDLPNGKPLPFTPKIKGN